MKYASYFVKSMRMSTFVTLTPPPLPTAAAAEYASAPADAQAFAAASAASAGVNGGGAVPSSSARRGLVRRGLGAGLLRRDLDRRRRWRATAPSSPTEPKARMEANSIG